MSHSTRFWVASVSAAAVCLALTSCDREPFVPEIAEPPMGSMLVVSSTTGASFDPDGFGVSIDGGPSTSLDLNDVLTIELPAGMHTVELKGIAANCSVEAPRRTVFVPAEGAPTRLSFGASCTPDRSLSSIRVVYARYTGDGRSKLLAMNGDGSGQVELTNGAQDRDPAGSPDGKKIAFVSNREALDRSPSLYVMNADGSQISRLILGAYGPRWSPDGRSLVFTAGDGWWGGSLFRIQSDGTGLLSLGNRDAGSPVFSPDGSRVAYVFADDLGTRLGIGVVGADGSNPETLVAPNRTLRGDLVWSPDGRHLAYSEDDGIAGDRDPSKDTYWIKLLNLQNGDVATLLESPVRSVFVNDWSTDGEYLLFTRKGDLYLLRLADRSLARLTADRDASNGSPTFLRRPAGGS